MFTSLLLTAYSFPGVRHEPKQRLCKEAIYAYQLSDWWLDIRENVTNKRIFHLEDVLSSICNIFPAGKSCSAEIGVKDEGTVSISLSAKYLCDWSPEVSPKVSSTGKKESLKKKTSHY